MGRYVLIVTHPDLGEMSFPVVANGTYHIGSQTGNDIVLPLKDVSRRHAVLKVLDGFCHVTDLKSKNGTFVAGRPTDAADFRFGETVRVSSASLVVLEEGSEMSPSGPVPPVEVGGDPADAAEPTAEHLSALRVADVVVLLGEVRRAMTTRSLTGPLGWTVRTLGAGGAMVLYGDDGGGVSLVASAGDLGGLVSSSAALRRMVERGRGSEAALHQTVEDGQTLVIATLSRGHVLVIRCGDQIPGVSAFHVLMRSLDILLDLPRTVHAAGTDHAESTSGGAGGQGRRLEEILATTERRLISEALAACGGVRRDAAAQLGVSPSALRRRMHRLHMTVDETT